MGRSATAHAGAQSAPYAEDEPKIVGTTPAQRFSATIFRFPRKYLERIAEAGPDTVKGWQSGRRFPQWEYLQRMQRREPVIRSFVAREFGFSENKLMAELHEIANGTDQEAAEARAHIRSIMRAEP